MVKEYLQYRILESIFSHAYAKYLCFLWWTALRIGYWSSRFSEDIDFDSFGISLEEFTELSSHVVRDLERDGFLAECRIIEKWAMHCYIKIPDILHEFALAAMKTQKILIQIDTAAQWYTYTPDLIQINKFWIQSLVKICSPDLLLAQKLYTAFQRKRIKWRDFFDIVYILGRTKSPDWWYVDLKLWITTPSDLKEWLLTQCEGVDFKALQADVSPFLFQPQNQSVAYFVDYVQQIDFQKA